MAEQKAPNWKDHLSSIPTNTANAPYKSGTKTLGAKELAAANARHAAEMALQREKLALSQWETQMRHNLSMMEFQALQADRARGWDFADRELALKYQPNPADGGAGGLSPQIGAFSGGYFGGLTPAQAINDFSVRNVIEATGNTQNRTVDRTPDRSNLNRTRYLG